MRTSLSRSSWSFPIPVLIRGHPPISGTAVHSISNATHIHRCSFRSSTVLSISPKPSYDTAYYIGRRCYATSPTLKSSASVSPIPEISSPLPRSISPSKALLLLTLPIPPSSWPPKLEFASPLLASASRVLKSRGVLVNAIYEQPNDTNARETTFDLGNEVYLARLFWADGTSHIFPNFSAELLKSGEVESVLDGYTVDQRRSLSPGDVSKQGGYEILVCTHGTRDCRCGTTGGELLTSLREEIVRLGLEGKVKVRDVAHVGGHKYAANAIILPSLDMLSNLLPSHAPHILQWLVRDGRDKSDPLWAHWRGRYGLSEIEQAGVWGSTAWAHGEEHLAEKEGVGAKLSKLRSGQSVGSDGEKVTLKFKTYEGEMREVQASIGETLLQVGKREGLPAIEGVCGGKLECATCHVYVPSSAPIPEESETELDMLGYALGYKDGESRLGCQIKVTSELGKWVKEERGIISLPRY